MRAARDVSEGDGRSGLRGRRTIALAAIGLAGAAGAVTAWAQQPLPSGNYGGGQIVDPPTSPYGAGNMSVGLKTGSGRVQILLGMGARCATATMNATATIAADGSFTASKTQKERISGGRRLRTKFTITGTITGSNASGTASASSTDKPRGRRARKCSTGTVQWGARRASGVIGTPGAAPAAARLYGTTSQGFAGRRHGIVLRTSADGTRMTRALYSLNYKCGRYGGYEVDTPRRNVPIGATGKVSDVERYSLRFSRSVRGRFTERFNATIGSEGATGTFNLRGRLIDRRTGRTFARCRSGVVKWTAAL
jgi:hypothetical protein